MLPNETARATSAPRVAAVIAALLAAGRAGAAQPPSAPWTACPRAALPAYAHNDYQNARPLLDALALGYRGAEADVVLVGGALRVGHDRRRARRAATLETVYLAPLRALAARCGALTADGRPFLLTVELKERSRPAYDSLAALLARHTATVGPGGPVEVVLVGWRPERGALVAARPRLVGVQARLTAPGQRVPADPEGLVRLVSLDYGKTMGRWWVRGGARRRWLAALRAAKQADPTRLVRVHNLPADATLYRALRAAGVDLIGTKTLAATAAALAPRGDDDGAPPHDGARADGRGARPATTH